MSRLFKVLQQQCNKEFIGDLELRVAFTWPNGECQISIHPQGVSFVDDQTSKLGAALPVELILYFSSEDCAIDILQGRYSPTDAFMNEDFKSNGYIMWAFQCLAIFSKAVDSKR